MKYITIFLICFFSSNLHCQNFDTESQNTDSNIYVFVLKKYIEKNKIKDTLVIEYAESIEPRNVPNEISNIKIVNIDYSKLSKKKGSLVLKIFPLTLKNGQFSVSTVNFTVSKPNKKTTHFINMMLEFRVIFEYDSTEKSLKYKSCRIIGCLGFTEFTD